MNLIKSRIRNSLTTSLLDDLMMIYLNGPKLKSEKMSNLLEKVYTRWIDIRARNVKKSHRESRPRPTSNKYEQQCEGSEESEHENEVEEVEEEGVEDMQPGLEHEDSAENLVAYVVDAGFMTLDLPDEQSFKNLIGSKFRKGAMAVRVAYKFDNGWQTGKWESVSDRGTRADTVLSSVVVPVHTINFNKTRHLVQLPLSTYGMEAKWCLVVEDKPEN